MLRTVFTTLSSSVIFGCALTTSERDKNGLLDCQKDSYLQRVTKRNENQLKVSSLSKPVKTVKIWTHTFPKWFEKYVGVHFHVKNAYKNTNRRSKIFTLLFLNLPDLVKNSNFLIHQNFPIKQSIVSCTSRTSDVGSS